MNVPQHSQAMFFDLLHTPIGELTLCGTDGGALSMIMFDSERARALRTHLTHAPQRLRSATQQLLEYFGGTRTTFDLELAPHGTAFQRSVWSALVAIPYGETRSYGWLAGQLGSPEASRAVGAANGRNPLPIVVPCHRVIGSNGTLTGYAGGLPIKRFLLELEAAAAAKLPYRSTDPRPVASGAPHRAS
jgi:methylated-DNA-[protein]-cysteine S-methyltransferase